MPFSGKNVIVAYSGKSGMRVDGGTVSIDGFQSFGNAEHGLDMHKDADVTVMNGTFTDNKGHSILVRDDEIVSRARAAGIAPTLNDDELFRALQTVHLADEVDRPRVLVDGPLWASYLKSGLDVAGALASIYSVFHGGPAV